MVWLLLFFLTHRDLRDSFLLVLVCFMILCIIGVLIYDTRDITAREIPDSYIVGMVWLRIRLPIWELSAESIREFSALPSLRSQHYRHGRTSL
jgi:hypothetical protein